MSGSEYNHREDLLTSYSSEEEPKEINSDDSHDDDNHEDYFLPETKYKSKIKDI